MTMPMFSDRLQRYRDDIARQLQDLEARHETLNSAWHRLRTVYQGEAAEAFQQAFQRASLRFEAQTQQLHYILPKLDATLETLAAKQQSEG